VKPRAPNCARLGGLKRVPCVLEKMLPLAFECSVVVARGADGAMVHLPVQRNLHRAGILAVTEVHEGVRAPAQARRPSRPRAPSRKGLDYVGVLCVEFFGLADGSLVVNEMAPRPHNSGHWSMDAADVSQFELQVRTLAGLPLVAAAPAQPAVMLNLLGDLWFAGGSEQRARLGARARAARRHLHLYGKPQARPAARWAT
jgi:5-(carboxyamino)imidazole ribonucleotide synthase